MMKLKLSDYSIVFGNVAKLVADYLANSNYSSINVLIDDNTAKYCLPKLKEALNDFNQIKIFAGEQNKTINTCQSIWTQLQKFKVDRHALMINLGGGVICDMGGFAASTYMRGIDFLQFPTTLLSQVDASFGGKLGVDFRGYKNFVGLFRNPRLVIIDSSFLNTLPEEELRSGYAEMIKHALIRDKSLWQKYIHKKDWKENLSNQEIYDSVKIKKEVVVEDPYEQGLRKILNFGHTLGHGIESYSFNTDAPLLHGYAVAIGMIGEAFLSHKLLGVNNHDLNEIKEYLVSIYQPTTDILNNKKEILEKIRLDKKNNKGKIFFSLLDQIGDCTYDVEVSDNLILESMKYISKA